MFLSPSPTLSQARCFAPGLSPARARCRHGEAHESETLKGFCRTEKQDQIEGGSRVKSAARQRKVNRARISWDADERGNGRLPASDSTVLLSGGTRRKIPRLQRQEAFHCPALDSDIIANHTGLDWLGILNYDDNDNKHLQDSTFGSDVTVHSELAYSIRPTKRAKRTHNHQLQWKDEDLYGPVEPEHTYRGAYTASACFFTPLSHEKLTGLVYNNFDNSNRRHTGRVGRKRSAEPLMIIYEPGETLTHSLGPIPIASELLELVSETEDEEIGTRDN
ncbi:hypothetical protein GGS21DRAFT_486548 [Xylaria nigripes]|nr:hypothetical protein GGS21DRAFT_486548 [Xylaria nigripes]